MLRSNGSYLWGTGTAAAASNVKIDRIIWLSTLQPQVGQTDADRVYYNRSGPVRLPGGQYLVLGPRNVTKMGLLPGKLNTPTPFNPASWYSPQEIDLSPSGTGVTTVTVSSGTISAPAALTMVVAGGVSGATGWPTGWSAGMAPNGFGINVSEPIFSSPGYYPPPVSGTPLGPNGELEWYGDPSEQAPAPYFTYTSPLETANPPGGGDGKAAQRPMVQDNATGPGQLLQTGTTINYKTLFLQRLANPSMPYDPIINPYLTVDWMPVDLTVYNGDDQHQWTPDDMATRGVNSWMNPINAASPDPTKATYQPWDSDDPVASTLNPANNEPRYVSNRVVILASRQRGGNDWYSKAPGQYAGLTTGAAFRNLWGQSTANQSPISGDKLTPQRLDPTDPYPYPTGLSTAGTSVALHAPTPVLAGMNLNYDVDCTLGSLNAAFLSLTLTPSGALTGPPLYAGDPQGPFPWIAWNNRPYANAMELLMVPSSHPGRLLWEFQFLPHANTTNPYKPPTPASLAGGVTYYPAGQVFNVPYPYLLNLFQSSMSISNTAPQLYRILEYVTVPSPFVQTETFVNPLTAVR